MNNIKINGKTFKAERFFHPDPSYNYERIPADLLRFAFTQPVEIDVHLPKETDVRVLSPSGIIESTLRENTLHFHLKDLLPVVVKAEGFPLLFLKPEDPASGLPSEDATVFPSPAETASLQCGAINQAMRDLSSQGGGTLSLSPGTYPIATLYMQSNVTLHLQPGAVLEATLDVEAYPVDADGILYTDLPPSLIPGPRRRVIYWHDCENAALTGRGTVLGQGSELRRRFVGTDEGRPLINLMKFVHARNCRVEDVTLADSEFWNTHVCLSEDIRFDRVAVINERPPWGWATYLGDHAKNWFWNNTDGINPDSSQRVEIRNSLLHTGDDCVAVKNTGTYRNELRDIADIQVHHNLMCCNTTPMKIGTETRGGTATGIHFHHNTVVSCSRMFAAELKDGLTVKDLRVEDIKVDDCNRPFDLEILPRQNQPDQSLFSNLEGAVLKNIDIRHYRNEGENWQSHLRGRDGEHCIRNVRLDRIRFADKALTSLEDEDLVLNDYAQGITLIQ